MAIGTDLGLVEAHLDKINHFILPEAIALKQKADRGEALNDFDLEFLEEVMEYHKSVLRTFEHHEELKSLSAQLSALYNHIVAQASSNEENKNSSDEKLP